MIYYDKTGAVIEGGTLAWARMYESAEYRRVAVTPLRGQVAVVTIWVGFNMNPLAPDEVPVIFESQVHQLQQGRVEVLDQVRYPTLAMAEAGHAELVKNWTEYGVP